MEINREKREERREKRGGRRRRHTREEQMRAGQDSKHSHHIHHNTMSPIDLISRPYTFAIADGRSIHGVLIAIDDQANLLVTNAAETTPDGTHTRQLGLISLRRDTIKSVCVSQADHSALFPRVL
jgi:small nuclear ribonucleoprotein (snRNP)-like protein